MPKTPRKRERVFINLDGSPFTSRPLTGMRNVVQMLTSPVVQSNIAVNFAISAAEVCSRAGSAADLAWRLGIYSTMTVANYAANRAALSYPPFYGLDPVIDKSGMAGGDPNLARKARMKLLRASAIFCAVVATGSASAMQHGWTFFPLIQSLSFPVMQGGWNLRAYYKIHKGDWTVQAAPPIRKPAGKSKLAGYFAGQPRL